MNDAEKINFKMMLKKTAEDFLHARIEASSAAMHEAQLAANEEGKSSVGDKYETSRAMAQIDRDIHARQLEIAQKDLSFIHNIDTSLLQKKVGTGAFVETSDGKYIFMAGLGPIEVNGEKILFLSVSSPIGQNLNGKVAGDRITFNSREIIIKDIY